MRKEWEKPLSEIIRDAKIRHEKERKAARRRGRKDFPMLPYEASWAFEEEYRRHQKRNPKRTKKTRYKSSRKHGYRRRVKGRGKHRNPMSTHSLESLAHQLQKNHHFKNGVWFTDYSKIPGLRVTASSTNGTSGTGKWHGSKVYFYEKGRTFHVERD